MKINIVNTLWWLVFIMIQVLIGGFILNNMMQCQPCQPEVECPWCISDKQIIAMWISAILGVPFLIWQMIRYIRRRE